MNNSLTFSTNIIRGYLNIIINNLLSANCFWVTSLYNNHSEGWFVLLVMVISIKETATFGIIKVPRLSTLEVTSRFSVDIDILGKNLIDYFLPPYFNA